MNTKLVFILLVQLFLIACGKNSVEPDYIKGGLQPEFTIEHYDITMEINPEQLLFQSDQSVTIAAIRSMDNFEFELHADLVIEAMRIKTINSMEIPITWDYLGDVKYSRGKESEIFSRYTVQTGSFVQAGDRLIFDISYHMQSSAIQATNQDELLKFSISETGSRALHPVNGAFPYFGGLVTAPFRFSLKHPADQYSSVPGDLTGTTTEGQSVVEVYESQIALIPVFYVNSCERMVRTQDGVTVEFLLAQGQSIPAAAVDHIFAVAKLYNERFGDPGFGTYRFAYVDVPTSSTTGESKGNAIYFARRSGDTDNWDAAAILNFVQLVSHELFHNWNIWSVHWQGKLYEWFVEGGAGFMSAWAAQSIMGEEAARSIRAGFVNGYHDRQGYLSTRTLENAQKEGEAEISLIYSYGALVWEQLRRKIGDEAFFSALGDFFPEHFNNQASASDLVTALQEKAGFPVQPFLDQWVKNNARIDLSISDVSIQSVGGKFDVTVQIQIESDRDYEFFTQLGYRTSSVSELTVVDVHAEEQGALSVFFSSDNRPVYIEIDPEQCLPQTVLDNDWWVE